VTLIKTVDKAVKRLDNEYNLFGLPTVYVDGGYKVLMGGLHEKSEYAQAIREAEARNVPKIKVEINSEYDNLTNKLVSNVVVVNREDNNYNGQLIVYLTEIISRWSGPEGEPYHYGFVDYIINKDITIGVNDEFTINNSREILDLDPENLMIISAVFNSEKNQGYSNPPDGNPFDAHFADAVNGTKVIKGGNLPPLVGITRPASAKIHVLGRPIIKTLAKNTILIGKTTIKVNASDDSGIKKVEFYIDDNLKHSDNEEPYTWSFRKTGFIKHIFRKHTIMVKAYDDFDKSSTDSIEVFTFFL
jgi:hypothetical protein